jgi:hypothetical protein
MRIPLSVPELFSAEALPTISEGGPLSSLNGHEISLEKGD